MWNFIKDKKEILGYKYVKILMVIRLDGVNYIRLKSFIKILVFVFKINI